MKKAIRFGLLAAGIVAALMLAPSHTPLAPQPAQAAVGICDPQQSVLCSGLVEWWNFEEAANSTRFGSYGDTPLYEGQTTNVDRQTSAGYYKLGSSGASGFYTNSAQLRSPRFGSGMFTSYWTVAAWMRRTSQGNYDTVFSTWDGSPLGGVLLRINSGNQAEIYAYEDETDTTQNYTHATALNTTDMYLVVWKLSPYGPYGKAQACISVTKSGDAVSAFTCGDLTYNVRSSSGDLTVGGRGAEYFHGTLDALGVWARAWSPTDLAAYYNSGTGRAFPFY